MRANEANMLNDNSAPMVSLTKKNKLQVEHEDGNGATKESDSESSWSSSSSGNLSDYDDTADVPWRKRNNTYDEGNNKRQKKKTPQEKPRKEQQLYKAYSVDLVANKSQIMDLYANTLDMKRQKQLEELKKAKADIIKAE